jgi:hypothetical protein
MGKIVISENVSLDGVVEDPIVVYASRPLVHTLMEHDLVDELRLMVYPFCARGWRAPLRRDQRQEVHSPPLHPDRR